MMKWRDEKMRQLKMKIKFVFDGNFSQLKVNTTYESAMACSVASMRKHNNNK